MNRDFKGVFFPKDIWLNKGLSLVEKALLIEIDSLDMGEDHCFASNGYLAEFADCSVDTVSRSIKKLVELEYIRVESRKTGSGVQRLLISLLSLRKMRTPPPQNADTPPPQNAEHSILQVLRLEENNEGVSTLRKGRASLPRFQKPTLEQVKAYCQERNNSVNPEKWLAHYEANGWRVGKNPMKDWKAAVRTWEHSDFGAAPKPQQTDDSWRFKDPRADRLKEAANAR